MCSATTSRRCTTSTSDGSWRWSVGTRVAYAPEPSADEPDPDASIPAPPFGQVGQVDLEEVAHGHLRRPGHRRRRRTMTVRRVDRVDRVDRRSRRPGETFTARCSPRPGHRAALRRCRRRCGASTESPRRRSGPVDLGRQSSTKAATASAAASPELKAPSNFGPANRSPASTTRCSSSTQHGSGHGITGPANRHFFTWASITLADPSHGLRPLEEQLAKCVCCRRPSVRRSRAALRDR